MRPARQQPGGAHGFAGGCADEKPLSHFFLTFAADPVVKREDSTAFGTGVPLFLRLHKCVQAVSADKSAVFHKARPISFVIAFLKIFYLLAGIIGTFKAVISLFKPNAILYLTFTAMFRFPRITVQTACTWLFMITMLITDHTIHSAGSKHIDIHIFFWHFHNCCSFRTSDLTKIIT